MRCCWNWWKLHWNIDALPMHWQKLMNHQHITHALANMNAPAKTNGFQQNGRTDETTNTHRMHRDADHCLDDSLGTFVFAHWLTLLFDCNLFFIVSFGLNSIGKPDSNTFHSIFSTITVKLDCGDLIEWVSVIYWFDFCSVVTIVLTLPHKAVFQNFPSLLIFLSFC